MLSLREDKDVMRLRAETAKEPQRAPGSPNKSWTGGPLMRIHEIAKLQLAHKHCNAHRVSGTGSTAVLLWRHLLGNGSQRESTSNWILSHIQ